MICEFVLLPVLHTGKTIGFSFPVHVTTSVANPELWFSTKLLESATKTFKYTGLVLSPQILFLDSVNCGWCWQCIFPAETGHLNPKRAEHSLCDLSAVWCPQVKFVSSCAALMTLRICQGELRVIQKQKEGARTSHSSVNKCKSLASTVNRAHKANSNWNTVQTFSLRPSMIQSLYPINCNYCCRHGANFGLYECFGRQQGIKVGNCLDDIQTSNWPLKGIFARKR